jgi:putative oxidoreductase
MSGAELTKPAKVYAFELAVWLALYAVLIAGAVWAARAQAFSGPEAYVAAILPALPIGGIMWSVIKFMANSDEYVRETTARRFVLAAGATMFFATVWGFAESFAAAPHAPMWWVVPIFWLCFGLTSAATARG